MGLEQPEDDAAAAIAEIASIAPCGDLDSEMVVSVDMALSIGFTDSAAIAGVVGATTGVDATVLPTDAVAAATVAANIVDATVAATVVADTADAPNAADVAGVADFADGFLPRTPIRTGAAATAAAAGDAAAALPPLTSFFDELEFTAADGLGAGTLVDSNPPQERVRRLPPSAAPSTSAAALSTDKGIAISDPPGAVPTATDETAAPAAVAVPDDEAGSVPAAEAVPDDEFDRVRWC